MSNVVVHGALEVNGIVDVQIQSDGSLKSRVDPRSRVPSASSASGVMSVTGTIAFGTQSGANGQGGFVKVVNTDGVTTVESNQYGGLFGDSVVKNFRIVGGESDEADVTIAVHFRVGNGTQVILTTSPLDGAMVEDTTTILALPDPDTVGLSIQRAINVLAISNDAGTFSDLFWSCEVHPA